MRYDGATLGELLEAVARDYPRLPGYLMDDHRRLRKHIAVFVDGAMWPRDEALSCVLTEESEVHILQALSGG
jgi:sulfur-carrier protein